MASERYLLRSNGHYLSELNFNGTSATFDSDPSMALTFTRSEREQFKADYPYITGRWILLLAELKRRAASTSKTTPSSGEGNDG